MIKSESMALIVALFIIVVLAVVVVPSFSIFEQEQMWKNIQLSLVAIGSAVILSIIYLKRYF